MNFEDLLQALCSNIEKTSATDFQSVYVIAAEKEARLAYDVLTAHAFDVKFYTENGESKLYITNPDISDSTVLPRLGAAIAYAHTLKHIASELDVLCSQSADILGKPSYSLSFVNMPATGGKQLLANITPAQAAKPAASPANPQIDKVNVASHKPVSSQPVAAPRHKTSKYVRKQVEEDMFSGPSLLSDNNKIISKKDQQRQEADTAWRQFVLYVKGNSPVAFSILLSMVMVMLTLFSLWIVSKGFLCPDLAHNKKKNVAWYCAEPEKEEKKQADEEPQ